MVVLIVEERVVMSEGMVLLWCEEKETRNAEHSSKGSRGRGRQLVPANGTAKPIVSDSAEPHVTRQLTGERLRGSSWVILYKEAYTHATNALVSACFSFKSPAYFHWFTKSLDSLFTNLMTCGYATSS